MCQLAGLQPPCVLLYWHKYNALETLKDLPQEFLPNITKTSTRSSGAGWCDQSGLLRPLRSGEPIRGQGRSGLLTPGHARSTFVLSDSKRSSSLLQGRLVLGWRGKTLLRSVWGLMRIGVIGWVLVLSEKKSRLIFWQNLKHATVAGLRLEFSCDVKFFSDTSDSNALNSHDVTDLWHHPLSFLPSSSPMPMTATWWCQCLPYHSSLVPVVCSVHGFISLKHVWTGAAWTKSHWPRTTVAPNWLPHPTTHICSSGHIFEVVVCIRAETWCVIAALTLLLILIFGFAAMLGCNGHLLLPLVSCLWPLGW